MGLFESIGWYSSPEQKKFKSKNICSVINKMAEFGNLKQNRIVKISNISKNIISTIADIVSSQKEDKILII